LPLTIDEHCNMESNVENLWTSLFLMHWVMNGR